MPEDTRQNVKGMIMNPIDTYKMVLSTMTHEELIEYTAILLRSLDGLGIEVLNDDIGDTEADK